MDEDDLELAEDVARRALYAAVSKAMTESGMRQAAIAVAAGIDPSTLSKLLHQPRDMRISTAARLLRAMGYWVTVIVRPISGRAEQQTVPLTGRKTLTAHADGAPKAPTTNIDVRPERVYS
jgi:transcriptional regulator with XRE-family HTH domain